jgi:hypothetical protein
VPVVVYKVVGSRYIERRVNLRVEHVGHSKYRRQEFLDCAKRSHEAHVRVEREAAQACTKRSSRRATEKYDAAEAELFLNAEGAAGIFPSIWRKQEAG